MSDTHAPSFHYETAFSRTVGYVTPVELQKLRRSRVAVAGLGGVGGLHVNTLARLGVGAFHLADFDTFEVHNFNRQYGSGMGSVGIEKAVVAERLLHDVNPEAKITLFKEGITAQNLDAFLEGVDLYIDGLDFFAFEARAMIFTACRNKGIPAITVAPLGMGAALINFLPGGMSFEEYFGWAGRDDHEKGLRFLLGLSPKAVHRPSLVWPQAVNLPARKGPSTPMACNLCAGVASTEALKILLGRGPLRAAPISTVYDAYSYRCVTTKTPGGLRHPLMRLRLMVMRRIMKKLLQSPSAA